MADAKLRLLIQASGMDALQLGSGQLQIQGVPFRVEPLFKHRLRAGDGLGIARTDWFVAEAEGALGEEMNPWDAAHQAILGGLGLGMASGVTYAEPDTAQEWVWNPTNPASALALDAADPCSFEPANFGLDPPWPSATPFTWFLNP